MTKTLRLDWVVVEKRRSTPEAIGANASGSDDTVLTALADSPATTRVKPMTVDQAAKAAAARHVLGAATNMPLMLIRATAPANPGGFPGSAWGIEAVRAHTSDCSGEGTTVAILDTGIDASHPAFQGVQLIQRNFTNGPDEDVDGHGTHCAGTIFGRDVNGKRIGIARGVRKALIGKVIGGDNGGTSDTLVKAVLWAQSLGADVISMSLGMDFQGFQDRLVTQNMLTRRQASSIALEAYRLNLEMFNKLSESVLGIQGVMGGSVVIGAAGNESAMPDYTIAASPPSNSSEFISVAAVSPKTVGGYELAWFSNVNAKLAAPGTRVWSAAPGGKLVEMEGTSMAAPHAAGVACLWYEKLRRNGGNPDASAVIFELRQSALKLVPGIPAGLVRWGLVQAPQP
ncbi:S8 family serine peptidase [Bradyrhizobium sp. BRP14]|nr:S8 family serine peptidase [Bradyrhizobium sp. BRP14]